jgi:uncharacterized membrane protein
MNKNRIDALTDGIIAIIITIMVLEMNTPHEASWKALAELLPVFVSYILSYISIGIYWGNHHHIMHTLPLVNSKIIWANFALLFFLSLVPFTTKWMGATHFDKIPVLLYALNFMFTGVAYYILQQNIITSWQHETRLMEALKKHGKKGRITGGIYFFAMVFAMFIPVISAICFLIVNIVWLIPDRNIEKALLTNSNTNNKQHN